MMGRARQSTAPFQFKLKSGGDQQTQWKDKFEENTSPPSRFAASHSLKLPASQ